MKCECECANKGSGWSWVVLWLSPRPRLPLFYKTRFSAAMHCNGHTQSGIWALFKLYSRGWFSELNGWGANKLFLVFAFSFSTWIEPSTWLYFYAGRMTFNISPGDLRFVYSLPWYKKAQVITEIPINLTLPLLRKLSVSSNLSDFQRKKATTLNATLSVVFSNWDLWSLTKSR